MNRTNKPYPRLLFLTPCAFNSTTGTGVTFTNLFHGWPKHCLATITDDPVPASNETCANYFHLTSKELKYIAPLSWFWRRTSRQVLRDRLQRTIERLPEPSGSNSVRPTWINKIIGTAGIPDRGFVSRQLHDWIQDFNPDIVFTILGTPGYFDLLTAICAAYRLPFVLHIMDHGTIDPLRTGLFSTYLRWLCNRRIRQLVPRASQCLAIGEAMAEEYSRKYSTPFRHFQNTIDLSRWESHTKKNLACGSPVRIIYIGSLISYAVLQSLCDCCQAVMELNRDDFSVQLEIYAPLHLFGREVQHLPKAPSILVKPIPVTDIEFFSLLPQADVLLLPVNFDTASIHYIRLSVPTKLPPYLASGVPILVYGPRGIAQVEYARTHRWGHMVDQRCSQQLKQGLRDICTNHGLREQLSHQARATADRFHDAGAVRGAFQEVLITAPSLHRSSKMPIHRVTAVMK